MQVLTNAAWLENSWRCGKAVANLKDLLNFLKREQNVIYDDLVQIAAASEEMLACVLNDVVEKTQKNNERFIKGSSKILSKTKVQCVQKLSSWSKMSISVVLNVFDNSLIENLIQEQKSCVSLLRRSVMRHPAPYPLTHRILRRRQTNHRWLPMRSAKTH